MTEGKRETQAPRNGVESSRRNSGEKKEELVSKGRVDIREWGPADSYITRREREKEIHFGDDREVSPKG